MRTIVPPNAVLVPQEAQRVFQGILYEVYQWQQRLYDGTYTTFEMLKQFDIVKTLAVIGEDIVVLEQEQPNHPLFYDVPGGRHDHQEETELEAAKRELFEETGITFRTWRLLNVTQPLRKMERFVYIYLATDLESHVDPQPDGGERIVTHLLPFGKAKSILAGPQGRYLPDQLAETNSLDELLALPTYQGSEPAS